MGETKKIVTEHYPVDKLPEELRRGLESGSSVRVTVEPDDNADSARQDLSSLFGSGRGVYSEEEAVTYIRRLRDE